MACKGDDAQNELIAFDVVWIAKAAADGDKRSVICKIGSEVSLCFPMLDPSMRPKIEHIQNGDAYGTA